MQKPIFRATLFLLQLVWVASVAGESWPGTPCSVATDCEDATTLMTCDIDTCQCTGPATFHYKEKQCLLPAGAFCDPSDSSKPLTHHSTCVLQQPGGSISSVVCDPGYPTTENYHCARSHEQSCDDDDDACDPDFFLQCVTLDPSASVPEKKCRCGDGATLSSGRCTINPNRPCSDATYPGPPIQSCALHSVCKADAGPKTCQCDFGLDSNLLGQCVALHGATCDRPITGPPARPCDTNSYLECSTSTPNVCVCRNPLQTFFDANKKNCTILADERCAVGQQNCVDFSKCTLISSGTGAGSYFCQCDPGLKLSRTKQCVTPYGGFCSGPTNPTAPCDAESFHDCVGSVCACRDVFNSQFDPATQSCTLLQGAACTEGGQPCAPNSYCMATPVGGMCSCNAGLTPNKERRCMLNYGSVCSVANSQCDSTAFMECNAGSYRCNCKDPSNTVLESGACKLRATAVCDPNPTSQQCVDNSECILVSSPVLPTFRCACAGEDLVGSSAGRCVRRYGATCGNDYAGDCDLEGHQHCSIDNRCLCLDPVNMNYNETDRTCRLKIGSECSELNEIPCESNLACVEGKCNCGPGLVNDGKNNCVKTFGTTCDPAVGIRGGCNVDEYLNCINNRCECDRSYTQVGTKCVGNYRAACKSDAECNRNASLVCDMNDYCTCYASEQVYDQVLKKCFSPLGGKCHIVNGTASGEIPLDCQPDADPSLQCEAAGNSDPNIGKCTETCQGVFGDCSAATGSARYSGALISALILFTSLFLI